MVARHRRKPETISTLKPEKDGLFGEQIFGPVTGNVRVESKRRVTRALLCERYGVEVTRAKVRRERMGHIELAAQSLIGTSKGVPSRLGYLLDIARI